MNYLNVILVIFIISTLLTAPRMVRAYLDPGTGSFIFQIIIAGVLAVVLSFKKMWLTAAKLKNKILSTSKKGLEKKEDQDV